MKYKVLAAANGGQVSFQGQQGPVTMDKIILTVDDGQGNTTAAEMLQKQGTPVPAAGEELEGTIEQTKFGFRFKKDRPAGAGFGGGKSRGSNESFALAYAKDLVVAMIANKSALNEKIEPMVVMDLWTVLAAHGLAWLQTSGGGTTTAPAPQNAAAGTPAMPPAPPAPVNEPGEINVDDVPFG